MVKSQVKSFAFIFCMVMLCLYVLAEEKNEKFCVIHKSFPGKCEDESEACVKDFIKNYGESKKPKSCSCRTLLPKNHRLERRAYWYYRFCTCEVPCNE
ncbi:hypothetical protein M5689_007949 [Euphorbia peplus]|nr:hypothetical protein M5689_007949 [Euphorbia peplus]